MAVVSMRSLLESGVHFGHQTRRWDPRMKPYIFAKRNGVHIIDLQKTMQCIKLAYEATRKAVLARKTILFVGTKKQARQAIEREAKNCGMFYVNNRWLGGTLTNFSTIKQSLLRLKKLEKMEIDGTFDLMSKKEVARLTKEKERLERNLGGIKDMKSLPGLIFIVDTNKEAIAVQEARSLDIPIVAVVDTNCNPQPIDFPIPGNDDAIRATSLFTQVISQAVIKADNEVGFEEIESMQEELEQPRLYENIDSPRSKFDDYDTDKERDNSTVQPNRAEDSAAEGSSVIPAADIGANIETNDNTAAEALKSSKTVEEKAPSETKEMRDTRETKDAQEPQDSPERVSQIAPEKSSNTSADPDPKHNQEETHE